MQSSAGYAGLYSKKTSKKKNEFTLCLAGGTERCLLRESRPQGQIAGSKADCREGFGFSLQ